MTLACPTRKAYEQADRLDATGTRIQFGGKVVAPPVAVSFLDAVPANVHAFEGTEPAGCSFWRLAAAGRVFYTIPKDHFNCAVGAHTHNLALSPEREHETEQTLKMMFDLGYVRPEEVPQIPRLAKPPSAIVYAPLGDTPVAPDVVLFASKPSAECCCKKRQLAPASAPVCRLLGVRRAWRYQLRWSTARCSASVVSVTACTPTLARMKSICSYVAKTFQSLPRAHGHYQREHRVARLREESPLAARIRLAEVLDQLRRSTDDRTTDRSHGSRCSKQLSGTRHVSSPR